MFQLCGYVGICTWSNLTECLKALHISLSFLLIFLKLFKKKKECFEEVHYFSQMPSFFSFPSNQHIWYFSLR